MMKLDIQKFADGSIIISTKLDTRDFETQLKEQERDLKRYASEGEKLAKLKLKIETENRELENSLEIAKTAYEYEASIAETEEKRVDIMNAYNQLEKLTNKALEVGNQELEQINAQITENAYKQEEMYQQIEETRKKLNFQDVMQDTGKTIEGITKKIGKWALALIGIRTAYDFIKSAINSIIANDPQLKADMDYIKSALISVIEPIARFVVEIIKKIIIYVAYLIKLWTGHNIFENASKNLKSANQQARELRKTLAGFDEMNILNENGSVGVLGATSPSFDLSNLDNIDIPKWIQWIGVLGQGVKLFAQTVIENTSIIVDGLKLGWERVKSVFSTVSSWFYDTVIDPILSMYMSHIQEIIIVFNTTWDTIKNTIGQFPLFLANIVPKIASIFKGLWEGVKTSFTNVWDTILNAFSKGGQIFEGIKEGIVEVFKAIVNGLISGINTVIRIPFDKLNGVLNAIHDVEILHIKPFAWMWDRNPVPVPQIPKLAKGGIINMPGRGVAIGGEAGREGVLPLTDSQQMALLGEAIGRYINISATIPVYVGNRQIAREMRKIEAENSFAFNR